MQKKEEHPPLDKSLAPEKNEPDVSLELFLEQNLNQKLDQSARHQEIPLEKIILKILTKRFKKS